MTWRELFAIQFPLQSFAPKISNKSVCWETENSAASLTVTSESTDFLDTQSYKTFKNIQSQRFYHVVQIIVKTIIIIVSIVSTCINCHRTSNSSKIATGYLFICVFTDSALRFPLGVCIDMDEIAIGWIGLRFLGQYLYCRQACKCVRWFQPCWNS